MLEIESKIRIKIKKEKEFTKELERYKEENKSKFKK